VAATETVSGPDGSSDKLFVWSRGDRSPRVRCDSHGSIGRTS
jgi:hypothetical protein